MGGMMMRASIKRFVAGAVAVVAAASLGFAVPSAAEAKPLDEYEGNIFFSNCEYCGKAHSSGPGYHRFNNVDPASVAEFKIEKSDNLDVTVVDNTYKYPSMNGSIYSKIVQIDFNSVGDGTGWFKVSDAANPDVALVSAFDIPVVDISGDEEAMLDSLAMVDTYHPDMPDGALEGVTTDMYRVGLVSDPLASYISISSPLSVPAMWKGTYQSKIDSMSPYADVPEVGGTQTLGWDNSLTAVFQGWDTSVVSDMNAAPQKSDFTTDHVEKDDRTGLTVIYHDVLFYAKWTTVDGKPIEYAPSLNGTLFDYNLANGVLTFPEDGSTWNELKVVIEGEGAAVIGDNYGLSGQYMLLSPSDFNMDDPNFNQDGVLTGPFYIRQTDSGDKAVISTSIADSDAWSYSLEPADAGTIEYDEANNRLLVSLDKPATLRINGGTTQEITNEDGASVSFVTSEENAANWEGVDLVTEWLGGDIAQTAGEAVASFAAQSQIAIDKMYVYDIHLEKGGVEVQPAELGSSYVRVTIPVPEGVDPSLVQVFHVADDGTVTNMSAAPVPAELGNAVYFYTDSFSTYVLAVAGEDGSASVIPNETVTTDETNAPKGDLPQTGDVAFMTVLGTTAVAGVSFAAAAIARRRER